MSMIALIRKDAETDKYSEFSSSEMLKVFAVLDKQDRLLAKAADMLNAVLSEKAMALGAEITEFRRQLQTPD